MKGNLNNQPNKSYAKLDERFDTDPLEAKIKDILGHCRHYNEQCWYMDKVQELRKEERDEDVVDSRLAEEQDKALLALLQQEKKEAERLGRIKENTYHWHRQKAIEAEAKNGGVSGYFLTRNEELQQPPNTEQEQS